MNQEIKTKWIAALKSGEYKQGTGYLKKDGKYCCLGVLCDLHAKETGNSFTPSEEYLKQIRILPIEVKNWAGLINNYGRFESNDLPYDTLWQLNDMAGFSFPEIADIIEKEF